VGRVVHVLLYHRTQFKHWVEVGTIRAGSSRREEPLGRQPPEYVGYVLLGYLVAWQRDHGPGTGCTAFHLSHRVPGLKTQRQERVQEILGLLEIKKLVQSAASENFTIYVATPDGQKWYLETAKGFYAVFERLYKPSELV
jgi:hypothetical protein